MNDWNNKMMKRRFLALAIVATLVSCVETKKETEWVYQKTIKLDGVNPIGIAINDGDLWLSDGDHNRLVQIDLNGAMLQTIDSLDRPMHIDASKGTLFVPQYGNDKVEAIDDNGRSDMQFNDSLDAPAAVSVRGNEKAVADFYNNRVLFQSKGSWISFGKEGKGQGEFYYPTDVQITDSLIWVADAYNNRIQVFDKTGSFVKMMGQDQKMNAATGLFVAKDEVFITDFENDRALVFDHDGNLKQELQKGIAKATDLMLNGDNLLIINYRAGELTVYESKEIERE